MTAEKIFTCWARLRGGELRRFDVCADGQEAALRVGFAEFPMAAACRAAPPAP